MADQRATELHAPHQTIVAADKREAFTIKLFDHLWEVYLSRVTYVQQYEKLVSSLQATFFNDHIAFRTIAAQDPCVGIATLGRIFESLGYQSASAYQFPDKNLSSIHFQHANPKFPKLFITELRSWELSPDCRKMLTNAMKSHRPNLCAGTLADLYRLNDLDEKRSAELLDTLVRWFTELPWNVPDRQVVQAVNKESQFGAWVLVHGYAVNHFTALVNSHQVPRLADIDKTVDEMSKAGIPMKKEIEGTPGSKLRQTATEAVNIPVAVRDQHQMTTMPWTYAYFELAERNAIKDPTTGKEVRFEGFLGPQATQLFEMTRVK